MSFQGGIIMYPQKIDSNLTVPKIVLGIFLFGIFYGCSTEMASTNGAKFQQIVKEIIEAQTTLKTIPSLSQSYPDLSPDEAYQIQDLLVAELVKKYGPVAGYKIGYADSSALKKNNLDIPAYGPFFKNRLLENGGNVPLKDFIKLPSKMR
jgi:2-keto-4-pentenoate hydratase